MLKGRKGN